MDEHAQVGVKLSDIHSLNQYLLNRAGLMITTTGLTATAAGLLAPLLPEFQHVYPGTYPILIYGAAVMLPLGAGIAAYTIPLSEKFEGMLLKRLGMNQVDPDQVPDELRTNLVDDLRSKLSRLNMAQHCLRCGISALVMQPFMYAFKYILSSFSDAPAAYVFTYIYYAFSCIALLEFVLGLIRYKEFTELWK